MILPIIFSILSPRPERFPARDELVNSKEEALAPAPPSRRPKHRPISKALLLGRDTTGWKKNAPRVEIPARKAYESDTNHQETSFREYSIC